MRETARSLLFVPGHQVARFDKARASGADTIVLDLEDAVPPSQKDEARATVAQWLTSREPDAAVAVRINGAGTPWFEADLVACAQARVLQLMLPKAEDAATLCTVVAAMPWVRLLPLVETARGIAALDEIATAPQVERLVFGSIDFQADLNIEGEGEELLYFRSRLVLASRVAGLKAPIDGVSTAIEYAAQVEGETLRARRLGFGGKLCIHPRQVAAVNTGFAPTPAQLDWARRVIAADAASGGVPVAVDGKMVDRPVVLKAQMLLRVAS